eukprot:TRINITY_DN2674_c0_g1_i1.p1 TRINITY_DN2674_c0_g1~~TRINITY_DN2674_c0_g1_i1.p1  ORF type:complete len:551 (+),score=85.55 TRINITY_DN2674_c0_g1_i1:36-1655(+)
MYSYSLFIYLIIIIISSFHVVSIVGDGSSSSSSSSSRVVSVSVSRVPVPMMAAYAAVSRRDNEGRMITKARPVPLSTFERDTRSDATMTVPLLSNYFMYVVDVLVGGQPFRLHVDTGSSLTAIPTQGCASCDKDTPNPYYGSGISPDSMIHNCSIAAQCSSGRCMNATSSGCLFETEYVSGVRLEGIIISDIITLGTLQAYAPFGGLTFTYLGDQGSTSFVSPLGDGIMGLAYGSRAMSCQPSCVTPLLDILITAHNNKNVDGSNNTLLDIFALGLASYVDIGFMDIGGVNESAFVGPLHYLPLLTPYNFYDLGLTAVIIDGYFPIQPNRNIRAAIDSGTSYILLPGSLYDPLETFFNNRFCSVHEGFCSRNDDSLYDGYCYSGITTQITRRLPTLSFLFGTLSVTIPATNYIIPAIINGHSLSCFAISYFNDPTHAILGDSFFRGNYLVFDREENQLGIAKLVGSSNTIANDTIVPPIPSDITTGYATSSASTSGRPPSGSVSDSPRFINTGIFFSSAPSSLALESWVIMLVLLWKLL